jgi:hypothetical protein
MESNNSKMVAVWVGLNAGGVAFLGVWGYAVASNDWLLGLAFGWIPAVIVGVIAGLVVCGVAYGLSTLAAMHSHSSGDSTGGPTAGITSQ